jgi:hypothetical protein
MYQSHNAQGTSRTFSLPSPETDSYKETDVYEHNHEALHRWRIC